MNPKQLIILASLLAVAVVIALTLPGDTNDKPDEGIAVGAEVFADLPVNDIAQVTITGDEKSVELERSGEKWVVKNRDGYAADFAKLRRVLNTLRDLKVADKIRAGESAYGRLEMKDPAGEADEKAGTRVTLKKGDGTQLAQMVLGKNYEGASDGSETGGTGNGRYLREGSDEGHVFIVSETFYELDPNPSSWLLRDFFRVQKPKTITITHPEGEGFKFFREKEGGELKMEGLAEDEELNTTNTGTIGSAFSSASFRDVAAGDAAKPEATGLDKPVTVEIETFEGFNYVVKLGEHVSENTDTDTSSATLNDTKYFLTVDVSAQLPETREAQEDEAVADDASDEDKKKAEDLKAQRDKEFEDQQKTLKEKLENEKAYSGIVYEVDSWSADKFFKKRDELVKKKEPEEPAETGTSPLPLTPGASITPAGGEPKIVATTPPISVADALREAEEKKKAAEEGAEPADGEEPAPESDGEAGSDTSTDPSGEAAAAERAAGESTEPETLEGSESAEGGDNSGESAE